jgi:hypothetical protein
MRTLARLSLGKLLGELGVPGIFVDQTNDASITRAQVRVRLGPLFSVVSVNGLDGYFHRLTGKIDGVGFSPTGNCKSDEIPWSARPAASLVSRRAEARS